MIQLHYLRRTIQLCSVTAAVSSAKMCFGQDVWASRHCSPASRFTYVILFTFTASVLHFLPSTILLFDLRSRGKNDLNRLQQFLRAGDFACEPRDHAKILVLSPVICKGKRSHVILLEPVWSLPCLRQPPAFTTNVSAAESLFGRKIRGEEPSAETLQLLSMAHRHRVTNGEMFLEHVRLPEKMVHIVLMSDE